METPDETEAETVAEEKARRRNRLRISIILLIVVWTFVYNVLIKEQSLFKAFFGILDTISDDFVMGTTLTVGVGLGIVVVFSLTKLYTQVIANVASFRQIEIIVYEDLLPRRFRAFWNKLVHLEDLPSPDSSCPERVSSLLLSFSFIYVMSWIYVILFSEALFFVSWSAGVDLPIDNPQNLLLLPTLALAIPFSARVMAYLRYPYTQDYRADLILLARNPLRGLDGLRELSGVMVRGIWLSRGTLAERLVQIRLEYSAPVPSLAGATEIAELTAH